MESTNTSAPNGNLAEYFVSYGGEENTELVMPSGGSSSEGCDQSGNIYISTPPDIHVEHVSVDKDGNLVLQTTSSKSNSSTIDQPKDINFSAQVAQPLFTSLPSTSQALPSENTFLTYKDSVVVEENKELPLAESSAANSEQKIFLLQPNAAENVNDLLANTVNNNAELAALRHGNENLVLNIITEDGQKLENVILARNIGGPLSVKPKLNLDTFPLPDGPGRNSQQMLQSYSKPITSGANLEKIRGYPGRRKPARGRGRSIYVPQPSLREFHMEKKFEMLSNFQELVKTSQSKIKPSTVNLSTSNCSKSDMVRAVNTDQNTIILTRSQPQQSLLQHPKTTVQITSPATESVKTLSASSVENPIPLSAASQLLTSTPKTLAVPKLVTTPIMMKTSDLKGMSHKNLQQLISMKAANVTQVSTRMNPTAKTESAKKGSNQMSTVVVIVPPCSKWSTLTADTDAKEKPLLENPSIMFSQNSSSNRTMLYEIPAKIIKFQEDKPFHRKLPFRHQDYLKVTKIQNEGEPIRPPGRFYKSRGSKNSVQISIPVVEKLPDGKGTKIINSAQQLNSMYPLLSSRLPQIAQLVDSSNMNIPQGILGMDAMKSEAGTSQKISSEILQDRSCTAMSMRSSFVPIPESSLSLFQKLELQVADKKGNVVSKDVQHIGMKCNTPPLTPENMPTFRHANVLRTYQELRSISQRGRSCSPSKMGTKNVEQNCLISSAQTSASGVTGIVAAEENSKVINIEIRQAVEVERQNEHNNMKSVTLESVLKGLEVASSGESTRPAGTSCTFKPDSVLEQPYCHEKLLGAISHKESTLYKNLEYTESCKSSDSALPSLYLNKQQTSIRSILPQAAGVATSDTNLTDSTQHKTDVISDHTFQKEDDLQLLPHSQNEANSESNIRYNQSSVNIDSLLAPQTSLSMKYEVQTSVARNLSAGLKTLDLDSFLALSTDDDEVGKDGSLISKEVCQDSITKHEELPVDHSPSKSEMACRLSEHFPEGVLYIEEETSSPVAPTEKNLAEEPGGSSMKSEESSGMTCDITQHTKELNIHSDVRRVHDVPDSDVRNTSENRSVNQSSSCLDNDVEHEEMETKSVSTNAISSENVIGLNSHMLQKVSTDSTQKLKVLSYESVQENVLQMQELSKDSNLGNMNVSELAAKSSKATEVSGCNTKVIEEPVKSSASTEVSRNKKETVSSELGLEEEKTVLSHNSLGEHNSDTQHNSSLLCYDQSDAISANITTSFNAPEINTKIKATNASLASSEPKSDETQITDVVTVNTCFQQLVEIVGSNSEAERTQKHESTCSSEQSFSNKGENTALESELENKLVPSEISGLRLTGDTDFRKCSNTDNSKACSLTSSEHDISEPAEEKLQKTCSMENKILSEMHFSKADNSNLLDEVKALHKQPALLGLMGTCSGETDAQMSNIATDLDKITSNVITEPEYSCFNNGPSVNLEMSAHADKDTKSEERFMKIDAPLEPMPSIVKEKRYSKQDDNAENSRIEEDISADNAELDADLYTGNRASKALSSQDKESSRVSMAVQESPKEALQPTRDPYIEKYQNETAIGRQASLSISSDAGSNKISTDDSADPVLKTLAATRATGGQPEESNAATASNVMLRGEKEHDNTKAESPEFADMKGIPVPSVINSSTDEKLNTANVRNETLSGIGSDVSSESHSNAAPVPPNVGILTSINVTKEANPAGMQGSNLSNINFINLFQPSKKMNPTGASKSHLLGYGNTVLLLPAINTQGSNVEHVNPAAAARNELNITEQSTLASPQSLGNQIRNKDEVHTDANTNSRNNVHQSSNKRMEPLKKCEKVHYQMPGFVLASEEGLSSLKEGQVIISDQTSKDTADVSPCYALQKRAEKESDDSSENGLFKVSGLDASSNINTFALEPLHGNDEVENLLVETEPGTPKQLGRERRRRKQSLEELRFPEEFMKVEVLPLQELSPEKKKRRYRKRSRTLAVDLKKELESSGYCGDTADDVKLKKDESKEIDKNEFTMAKMSHSADNSSLSVNLQEVTDRGESFSVEVTNISSEDSLISNKPDQNLKETEGQCSQEVQAGMGNIDGITNLTVEGEVADPHCQEHSRDEDSKAKESKGLSPQTPKLADVDAKERGSHLKRKLFKQLSSEDLPKKDEKKSKKILSKAKSSDHALLSTDLEHNQQNSEADGPGSSSELTVISQSTKKSRVNLKKQKTEEEIVMENENQNISSPKVDKTIKSCNSQLTQAAESKISDSKSKKAVPKTVSEKQLSKMNVKGLKESIKRISRRASLKHKFIKKDDTPGTSTKSLTASDKSSFPAEKKGQRTARLIRELKKRMTPRYRKQESLDSLSKKENLKTNAKKLKTETKTRVTATENQRKEKPEQGKTKLRRSARQYIRKKMIKIRMSLKMKNQNIDTALLNSKRISSIEKLQKGMDTAPSQRLKTRGESHDRKKCPEKVIKSKRDNRKKFSTLGRKSLQTQRSSSPEYPIAIPMPHDAYHDETAEKCAQKENEDTEARTPDKNITEAKNIDDSEMNAVSTNVRKDCLQNECDVKGDTANLENSTQFKIISVPSTEEETRSFKEVAVESDKKMDISLKADEISECKADSEAKGTNVISADTEEIRMENDNIETDARKLDDQIVANESDKETAITTTIGNHIVAKISLKETADISKLDDQIVANVSDKDTTDNIKFDHHIVSSDVQVDETDKVFQNVHRELTEGASIVEMSKSGDIVAEDEEPRTNQLVSNVSDSLKTEKDTKPEPPKKKFFKHREPGQMRNKRFTCIFNIEDDEKELLDSVIRTEKPAASALEGPIRDTEEYRMYGKRSLEMADYHELTESATDDVDRSLQLESHMIDIGINLPEIPDITFISPSEKKWPLAAKEMKCYMGKRRRLLYDVEEEEELEKEEVKEEPQEEMELQSSRWPETTRKRCYPGKRAPKFSQEYHPCSFLKKKSPERSSLRSYVKSKTVDSPEDTDKTLSQFKQRLPKILSKCAAMEENRQQKCNVKNAALDDEGKLEDQVSTSSVKGCTRTQVEDSHSGKKETEQRFNVPPHLLGRSIGDPASDPTERKQPLQQPRIGVRVPYRNLTSQIVSSQEIVREILERSKARNYATAMAMNKRVADAVDRSFSKRLNASLARVPMPSGPEELDAALQASADTKLKLLPQSKEHNWRDSLPSVIGSSAMTTVTTLKSSSSYTGNKSGTRSRSSTRGKQGTGLYLEKESEREIALRQLETLPSRCRSSRRQAASASAVKVTKPKKLDWCKQRSRRKQSK